MDKLIPFYYSVVRLQEIFLAESHDTCELIPFFDLSEDPSKESIALSRLSRFTSNRYNYGGSTSLTRALRSYPTTSRSDSDKVLVVSSNSSSIVQSILSILDVPGLLCISLRDWATYIHSLDTALRTIESRSTASTDWSKIWTNLGTLAKPNSGWDRNLEYLEILSEVDVDQSQYQGYILLTKPPKSLLINLWTSLIKKDLLWIYRDTAHSEGEYWDIQNLSTVCTELQSVSAIPCMGCPAAGRCTEHLSNALTKTEEVGEGEDEEGDGEVGSAFFNISIGRRRLLESVGGTFVLPSVLLEASISTQYDSTRREMYDFTLFRAERAFSQCPISSRIGTHSITFRDLEKHQARYLKEREKLRRRRLKKSAECSKCSLLKYCSATNQVNTLEEDLLSKVCTGPVDTSGLSTSLSAAYRRCLSLVSRAIVRRGISPEILGKFTEELGSCLESLEGDKYLSSYIYLEKEGMKVPSSKSSYLQLQEGPLLLPKAVIDLINRDYSRLMYPTSTLYIARRGGSTSSDVAIQSTERDIEDQLGLPIDASSDWYVVLSKKHSLFNSYHYSTSKYEAANVKTSLDVLGVTCYSTAKVAKEALKLRVLLVLLDLFSPLALVTYSGWGNSSSTLIFREGTPRHRSWGNSSATSLENFAEVSRMLEESCLHEVEKDLLGYYFTETNPQVDHSNALVNLRNCLQESYET